MLFLGCFFALFLLTCGWDNNEETNRCQVSEEPLLLTPYLDNNDSFTARWLSYVDRNYLEDFVPLSFSGFLTVDRKLGNHLFFWFFPSPTNETAPLVLWLNGGPGVSSMFGMLYQHGPMEIDTNTKVKRENYSRRNHSWVGPFSMLYVDNPVNVGFSFSDSGRKGEKTSEEGYTSDLFNFLEQFFLLYPRYKDRELYIGGQSYAGMYVMSLAHYIHSQREQTDINLTGIYLGGPYFDPPNQLAMQIEFHYQLGAISYKTRTDHLEKLDDILNNRSSIWNENGYSYVISSAMRNNFVTQTVPAFMRVDVLMNRYEIKKAVHAGVKSVFKVYNGELRKNFDEDFITSRREKLAVLLDNYKVLLFNGDVDSIVSTAMIEAALMSTPWKLQRKYNTTTRFAPTNSKKVFHHSRVGHLCRVIVCGAGHQTAHDRPWETLKMMKDFVHRGCLHYEDTN